ncbi:hypothetical protein [Rhizobium leguminosarum]|uniref:hypothetical protein n=1 Tax=Rhizobium leguminosarum TaxID=384 RepID=UPI001C9521D1|nr:hypothetical protein [Rhizobium leguminosarum]MBY5346041.1 hypothetical protein [Rhizobium leguminosarum]
MLTSDKLAMPPFRPPSRMQPSAAVGGPLGVIEDREIARLQGQLDDIAEHADEVFSLATLELAARGNEIWFRIAGYSSYGWKFVEFADVEMLLAFDVSSDDSTYRP